MCDACEAKREARVVAAALSLLGTVDYQRLRYYFATVIHNVDLLRESLEHNEERGGIPLDSLFSDEDDLHKGLKASIMVCTMCDDFVREVEELLSKEGFFAVPTQSPTPSAAEAFQTFVDNELKFEKEDDDE